MKLYNKMEIACEMYEMGDLRQGKTSYLFGKVSSYDVKEDKKYNFLNLKTAAFGKIAEDMADLFLKEGDFITLKGSIQQQSYKDIKYFQLIISSFQADTSPKLPKQSNDNEEYVPAVKRDNPYRKNDNNDAENEENEYPI